MLSPFPDLVVATNNARLCPHSMPVRGWSANRNLGVVSDKIALALIDRVAGVLDSHPTSESPFDSSGHVIAQFLRSLQRSLDPDNLHLAGGDLSGRFAVTSRSHQAALVAG